MISYSVTHLWQFYCSEYGFTASAEVCHTVQFHTLVVNGMWLFVVWQYTHSVTQRRFIVTYIIVFISEFAVLCSTEGFHLLCTPIWERSTVKIDVTNLKVGFLVFTCLLSDHSVGWWVCYGSCDDHYVFYGKKCWFMLLCVQKLSARFSKALIQRSRCINVVFAVSHKNSFTWNHTWKFTFVRDLRFFLSNVSYISLPSLFFFCVRTVCNCFCEAECSGEIDPLRTYFTGQSR